MTYTIGLTTNQRFCLFDEKMQLVKNITGEVQLSDGSCVVVSGVLHNDYGPAIIRHHTEEMHFILRGLLRRGSQFLDESIASDEEKCMMVIKFPKLLTDNL